jgi:mono/diheme cytochrome c family protein
MTQINAGAAHGPHSGPKEEEQPMRKTLAAMVILPFLVAACAPDRAAREKDSSLADVTRGATLFAQNCAACHGLGARGDGPLAEDLPVPPADLTVLALANHGEFPTGEVIAQVHGYPGRFHSAPMPEFGPLLAGDMRPWRAPDGRVVPTPSALLALAAWLESVQQEGT